jgi:hypothetical protein
MSALLSIEYELREHGAGSKGLASVVKNGSFKTKCSVGMLIRAVLLPMHPLGAWSGTTPPALGWRGSLEFGGERDIERSFTNLWYDLIWSTPFVGVGTFRIRRKEGRKTKIPPAC